MIVSNTLKLLMATLALAGITGLYLRQVKKMGVLGLLGYVLFSGGFLGIVSTSFVAAFLLPSLAHSAPAYVADVIAAGNNGNAIGDIGLMQTAILVTGIGYLIGGFIFGIALFRANVLARWATALLAAGTVATIATGMVPQSRSRLPTHVSEGEDAGVSQDQLSCDNAHDERPGGGWLSPANSRRCAGVCRDDGRRARKGRHHVVLRAAGSGRGSR